MWIQRLTSYQFRILFYLRGSKELSTEKTLPKKFYKGLCSGLHVATMFWSALGPSLRYPPLPPPAPSNVVHQKRTHFHPFRSQVNIVWSGSHLSFTDITGEFPTLLTSYAVWVQHWSQTFLCCQWHGVNLQAIFQQLFWNYCIYKSDTAVAEQCQNQCIALIALTNLSDKIKLVNGLIFQLNMTD